MNINQDHINSNTDRVIEHNNKSNNKASNNITTLSRNQIGENQKIERKMLTTKSLKRVNKQVSSQEKLVKKELKKLYKLKAELKKHSSKKLEKEYSALLRKYKSNKKYQLALVAEQNTVNKYLKSAMNLKKDQKALNSVNKKLAKDKKELKHHISKKLKKLRKRYEGRKESYKIH